MRAEDAYIRQSTPDPKPTWSKIKTFRFCELWPSLEHLGRADEDQRHAALTSLRRSKTWRELFGQRSADDCFHEAGKAKEGEANGCIDIAFVAIPPEKRAYIPERTSAIVRPT